MKLGTLFPLGLSAASALVLVGVALVWFTQASAQGAPQGTATGTQEAPASSPPSPDRPAPEPAHGAPGPHASKGGSARAATMPALIDTSTPFHHDHHLDPATMGRALTCASCHEMVKNDGTCPKEEVRFPTHAACTECHAANFYTRPLTICVNCHQSAKFAAANPLRELQRFDSPKKAEFSHKAHLGPTQSTDCTSCHQVQKQGAVMGHPSHPNCCACHASPGPQGKAVKPAMNECNACHNASKSAGRPPSKIHGFSHKDHREDPRTGTTTSCQQCHVNMVDATTLGTVAIPPMATCVQCHDGSDPTQPHPANPAQRGSGAFHFSSCMRCHVSGAIAGQALPASHPKDPAPPGAIQ